MHNIVIYDNKTDWFCSNGTVIVSISIVTNGSLRSSKRVPAGYGYVLLELEDDDANFEGAYIACASEMDCLVAYDRCCDAILNHPKVIDLRHLDAKLYEDND